MVGDKGSLLKVCLVVGCWVLVVFMVWFRVCVCGLWVILVCDW